MRSIYFAIRGSIQNGGNILSTTQIGSLASNFLQNECGGVLTARTTSKEKSGTVAQRDPNPDVAMGGADTLGQTNSNRDLGRPSSLSNRIEKLESMIGRVMIAVKAMAPDTLSGESSVGKW